MFHFINVDHSPASLVANNSVQLRKVGDLSSNGPTAQYLGFKRVQFDVDYMQRSLPK